MYTIVESLYRTPETHVTQCATRTGIDMKNLIRKNIVKKKKNVARLSILDQPSALFMFTRLMTQ